MAGIIGFLVVIIGIFIATFLNYPPPPQSPLLYQWQSSGKNFSFNGFTIFYKDEKGEGTDTILCLHGFPTSSYDWYKVWPSLKRHFKRVIALDFLGLGFSDKPRYHQYSISQQATIVETLLQMLHVKETHILAHDYGDTVAQELLARQLNLTTEEVQNYTFRINSLCLLNGGIFPGKYCPRWSQQILLTPVIGTILSKLIHFPVFKRELSGVFGKETQPSESELRDFWGIVRYQNGYRVFRLILSYIKEREENESRWVNALRKTKVPVHLIFGPADPVNPQLSKHYRKMMNKPSITVLPKHIGHYVQLEAPEDMIKSYFNFLDILLASEMR